MSRISDQQAEDFIRRETQFHLGFLPTEQSNPKTRSMEADFQRSAADGVKCMQQVDLDVLEMAQKVLPSPQFRLLAETVYGAIAARHKVVFSGCGATGRLAILLDAMWREACSRDAGLAPYLECSGSIMTGGDYALVRSVEFFEDYAEFGRQQVREMHLGAEDVLIAITEGGETSSVLGTLEEALNRGTRCFLLFNNPAELLAERLERSRRAIRDPRVTVLDLFCGPMALSGSTRLQATTSEQLIAGAALEMAAYRLQNRPVPDYAAEFRRVLDALMAPAAVAAIAGYIEFEEKTYRAGGKITYFTNTCLLDIFTDTTERCPTFMTPPFCRKDTPELPQSWSFVKHDRLPTREAWRTLLHRPLQCLAWTEADYVRMGAAQNIIGNPPHIAEDDLLTFEIGNEAAPLRHGSAAYAGIALDIQGDRKIELPERFAVEKRLAFGCHTGADYLIPLPELASPLHLMLHMALKLALNVISTGTMVRLGRVSGNWMSYVDLSNKKLIDRGTRLVAELAHLDYESACKLLFAAREECRLHPEKLRPFGSVVQYALHAAQTGRQTSPAAENGTCRQ